MMPGTIRTLAKLWAARERTLADWWRFNESYATRTPRMIIKPKRPKWGQPGRGRRRKARFAARKRERLMQELRKFKSGACLILPQGAARCRGFTLIYRCARL